MLVRVQYFEPFALGCRLLPDGGDSLPVPVKTQMHEGFQPFEQALPMLQAIPLSVVAKGIASPICPSWLKIRLDLYQ